MNIRRIYEYLVQVVHPFMAEKDECLYNALVLKQVEQTDAYLLEVRDRPDRVGLCFGQLTVLEIKSGCKAAHHDPQTERRNGL